MDLERGFVSSSSASTSEDAAEDAEAVATDRMEMEAAEILAALAHSKKRDAVAVAAEFSAKWGCKGKRVRKRVSRSESPHSDTSLNPVGSVQSGSDLAEQDRATVGQQKVQVTSTTVVIESVEAEQNAELLNTSHPCTARYTSNGVVRSRENVTEADSFFDLVLCFVNPLFLTECSFDQAEKETCRLHGMLTNKESDWQMIHERQILFSMVGMREKDIWKDRQQDQITGNNVLIKSVKAEQNALSVKSSPTCSIKYISCGRGRSSQNLTEAEKETRRLHRILANRESARQTIRRRQALCEKLTLKVADLTRENENLKRAKELALKECQFQESTNKHLKTEMAKAIKPEEGKSPGEVKLARQISGPCRNYPFFFYNQHPFPPFCWPSVVRSSHPFQSQCGHQGIFAPPGISTPNNGRLDSSHDQENPININGPRTPLYVVPYPWFFSLPDHRNGLHPQPSCCPKDVKDESSVNNQFSAGCSLKSVVHEEKYNSSLSIEVEKEAYGSIEASPSKLNCTPVRLPPDGGGQCMGFNIKEEVLVPAPVCSAGTTFVVERENTPDHGVNTESAPIRACHCVGALPEENQESTNYTSKKVLDAVAAAEARKRRKELTKLKNLHGRQCWLHR
ncbi:uncharacterized protein LOC111294280 [Durio zibethinus]|uniref:Uncharacterized protein LOC111294280 n=1 Tax=Durio zibethinus TaxID=66656 RepID=A0A6P5YSN1_DURZI|nr:uncharacterized protein LOC111294280 [Durio zibethinus]